jgi:hypothetical protein
MSRSRKGRGRRARFGRRPGSRRQLGEIFQRRVELSIELAVLNVNPTWPRAELAESAIDLVRPGGGARDGSSRALLQPSDS